MGYKNCCSPGYIAEAQAAGDYNINSHGDIGAFYNSLVNADLPRYTAMFYHPSEHEMISDVKYSKLEVGYDKGLKEMRDSAQGLPMEAYVPLSILSSDTGSAVPTIMVRNTEVMPKKTIVDEIMKAQAEIIGRKNDLKHGESFMIRETHVEEQIHILRRLRRLEIIKKN